MKKKGIARKILYEEEKKQCITVILIIWNNDSNDSNCNTDHRNNIDNNSDWFCTE